MASTLSNLPPCITITTHWLIIFFTLSHNVVQLSTASHIRIRSSISFDICPSALQTAHGSLDAKCPDLVSLTFHIFESKRGKWQAVSPPFSIFILHIILIALSSHIYIFFFPREAALAAARSHCSIARIKCFIQLTLLHTILRGLQLWRGNKSSQSEEKKTCILYLDAKSRA